LYSANEYDTYIEALKYVDSLNSIDLNINANGVLIGLNDYDITLQTDGLLIWHINDPFMNLMKCPTIQTAEIFQC